MLLKKIRYHLSPKPPKLSGCTMGSARRLTESEQASLTRKIAELGPWFHNYELASGVFTNPENTGPGSDYPARRWVHVQPILPDVRGKRCLDVGSSSGFFSLKLKELGASYVLGVDFGEQSRAMEQARFAAATLGLDVEFRPMSVYDAAQIQDEFDLILFMGVLYHLRHPMVALEALRKVAKDLIILQTITTRNERLVLDELDPKLLADVGLGTKLFDDARFPTMQFIEGTLNGDVTCWFMPNPPAVTAMMRSCGFSPVETLFPSPNEIMVKARAV